MKRHSWGVANCSKVAARISPLRWPVQNASSQKAASRGGSFWIAGQSLLISSSVRTLDRAWVGAGISRPTNTPDAAGSTRSLDTAQDRTRLATTRKQRGTGRNSAATLYLLAISELGPDFAEPRKGT